MRASVIMNTYNENPVYLGQAVDSYLNQKGVTVQLIVSTVEDDKNLQYLKSLPVDLAILKKADHPGYCPEGSFAQLNNAISLIKYESVTFASSNDVSLTDRIYKEIKYSVLGRHKVCYSDFYYVNANLKILSRTTLGAYNRKRHQQSNFVSDCALVNTKLFKKHTPFRWEDFGNFSYWDLWLRIYREEGNVFCYNSDPTWYYRQGNGMHSKARPAGYAEKRERMLSTHR